jgi:hypothetical protein
MCIVKEIEKLIIKCLLKNSSYDLYTCILEPSKFMTN